LETVKELIKQSYIADEHVPHLEIAQYLIQIEISITEILNLDEADYRREAVQSQQLQRNLPRKKEGEEGIYFEENPN
jgi:hypothetical protein